MKTLRVFISSPGDVAVERDKARKVVEALQKRYAGRMRLETVLWEDLPLGAVDSFQGGIDVVLKGEHAVDIAVFILWSRLGSPLGAAIRRPDGSPYRSGTEREFDLMLTARAQSPDNRPEILVYVRQDDHHFKAALQETPTDQIEEMLRQHKLAEQFIREQFHDVESGSNLRAYHTFPEPNSFAERLKTHLRSLLDTIVMDGGLGFGSWEGSPYRGLEVFRAEHAPIFFGRDEEVCDILERLRAQAAAGCAFLLLVGASGSGKSSLARAGVLPALETDNPDESVAEWRTAALTPGECADGLCRGLARTLLERLPELRGGEDSLDDLEAALRDGQGKALSLLLKRACAGNPATAGGGPIRLVLLEDQLEELFTHPAITEVEAAAFLAALQALAVTGCVWVLATVRSDFYDQCQRFPVLMAMKGERGQMDLLPPEPSDIHRIVTGPALLAGVAFEKNAGGESLDQRILNDAVGHPEALPLLEFALAQLYEARTSEGLLTFAAYGKLGGVEGAIGHHAEAVFAAQPEAVRAAFGPVFQALVALDESDEARPVRRRVALDTLAATPERRQLVEALLAARLLSSDRGEVFVAHEALLRRWERAVQWIEANRDRLRVRDRIAARMAEGAPLAENDPLTSLARHHLAEHPDTFAPAQRDYIATQLAQLDAAKRRRKRLRIGAFILMGVITFFSLTWSVVVMTFIGQVKNAQRREWEASIASEEVIADILQTLTKNSKTCESLDQMASVNDLVEMYYSNAVSMQKRFCSPTAFRLLWQKLFKQEDFTYPFYSTLFHQAEFFEQWGDAQQLLGNTDRARECFQKGLSIAIKLSESTDSTGGFEKFRLIGNLQQKMEDPRGALKSYQKSLSFLLVQVGGGEEFFPLQYFSYVRGIYMKLANLCLDQGDPDQAREYYRKALPFTEKIEIGTASDFYLLRLRRCKLQLLLGEFQEAKDTALGDLQPNEKSLSGDDLFNGYLPYIYMYLGEKSQAEELCRRYKGRILHNGSKWEEAVAEDFATFRKLGMEHPQMKEIEALLGVEPTGGKGNAIPTNRVEQAEGISP